MPLVAAMKAWLETQLTHIPPRGGLADAIRYALTRWSDLSRFLDDGRIELDTNTVERAIRPITLGRKKTPVRRIRSRGCALGDHPLPYHHGKA